MRRVPRWIPALLIAFQLATLIALSLAPPAAAGPESPRAGGAATPTVATEDTMHTEVPEVLVRAPRVTLDEILARVAQGEARRDSMIHDESFRVTARLVRHPGGDQPAVLAQETVYQVYRRRPHDSRSVMLRNRLEKNKKDDPIQIGFGKDIQEDLVNFAFQPKARRQYRYRIEGRDLVGGHLIYRIAFEPKSFLNPGEPGGRVWIDTNEFVILRQELGFARSPVPILLKSIPQMVIERGRVGDLWVLRRVMMRAETTIPFPGFGNAFDFALLYGDYHINAGVPDSVFAAHAEPQREEE